MNLRNENANEPEVQSANGDGHGFNGAALVQSLSHLAGLVLEVRRQLAEVTRSVAQNQARNNELEEKKKALEMQKMLQDVEEAIQAMRIQVTYTKLFTQVGYSSSAKLASHFSSTKA